jgi:hypothetical protein
MADSQQPTRLTMSLSEMLCQGWEKVSVICAGVCASDGCDVCVVCDASEYPHHENRLRWDSDSLSSADVDDVAGRNVLHHRENVSDVAWR